VALVLDGTKFVQYLCVDGFDCLNGLHILQFFVADLVDDCTDALLGVEDLGTAFEGGTEGGCAGFPGTQRTVVVTAFVGRGNLTVVD
jgi:hypothetical protein